MGHPNPRRPQKSPHKWREIDYGSKIQLAPDEDDSKPLDEEGIRWVQMVIGALLYYRRDVDNKILTTLSAIGSKQSKATKNTKNAINMIFDYCATYLTMKSSIDQVIWCYVDTQMLGPTTKVDPEVGLVHTYSFLRMTTSQDGIAQR